MHQYLVYLLLQTSHIQSSSITIHSPGKKICLGEGYHPWANGNGSRLTQEPGKHVSSHDEHEGSHDQHMMSYDQHARPRDQVTVMYAMTL